jgi:hypothetical protein
MSFVLSIALPTSIWLSDRRIKDQRVDHSTKSMVVTAPLQTESIGLFSDENCAIKIDHLGSFGEQIDYRETISVEFKNEGTSEDADLLLDALCLLVSVITQARCWPPKRNYYKHDGDFQEARRHSWIDKQNPTTFYDWLELPGKIIDLIRQILPGWICAVRNPRAGMLIRHFVTAANNNGYAETAFLAFCQCFEGLNTQRIGDYAATPACDAQIMSQINDAAKNLGLNSAFRRRVRKAFEDAMKLTLEERLKNTLPNTPFCIQEVMRSRPNIYAEIARRRNQLSHGSTNGIIRTQADFEQLLTETAVLRALCLAEVLLLAGMQADQVAEMIRSDIKMKYLRIR